MKSPTPAEISEFPEVLVPRLWAALCERLHDPVTVSQRRGMRVVELLGCARYLVMPTARLVHFAFGAGKKRFRTGRMKEFVSLDPVLPGHLWLAYFAANWLVARGAEVAPHEMEGFIVEVRKKPAFQRLLERVQACHITEQLRPRLAKALDLDPRILARARLGIPRGEKTVVDSHQYTAVWRHAEGFAQVEHESPALLRPYAGAVLGGLLGLHDEPVRDLKRAFRCAGIGDAGWKLLVTANPAALAAAIPGAANTNVFEIYCWALQACLAADLVPPPALMNRLVMPYGREPGAPVRLRARDVGEAFWPAFLRALGRRLATVEDAATLRTFLDGEFEDVYDWLEWERPEIDANQARAGWTWMLKQHRAWQEREREVALANRDELCWTVPVPTFEHSGYCIEALTDSYELWEEGRAMRHCVRTYSRCCLDGEDIVFSIRDAFGRRMATGHIGCESGTWVVRSVRLFANRPARRELWEVARVYARACDAASPRTEAPSRLAA